MDTVPCGPIRNGLYAVAREMKRAMLQTATRPIIRAGGDASAAIFDARMQLVAQGNDIPTMMGSAVMSAKASVEAIGVENLRPGDTIISNDDDLGGGNHQPDVPLTRPVFLDGKIIASAMTRGHRVDVGGTVGSAWRGAADPARHPKKPVEDLSRGHASELHLSSLCGQRRH